MHECLVSLGFVLKGDSARRVVDPLDVDAGELRPYVHLDVASRHEIGPVQIQRFWFDFGRLMDFSWLLVRFQRRYSLIQLVNLLL